MPAPPNPVPATGDAYAGGYAFTTAGLPQRQSPLSPTQFGNSTPWESPAGKPLGSNTPSGSSL